MKTEVYFQPRTAVQDYYYDVRGRSPDTFSFFTGAKKPLPDFTHRYVLMNEVHRRLHPFQFVRPGDTAVHVGFDRVYFNKGQSHPLLLASLVGPAGHVLAIDPDRRNTEGLAEYCRNNGIQNVEVVNRAAWNKPDTLEFTFDGEWGPMSVATNVAADPKWRGKEYTPGRGSIKEQVQAELLDTIVSRSLKGRKVTWLGLTANGAEPQIVAGASALLAHSPDLRIGIALAFHHFSYEIRKSVCIDLTNQGFSIVVADAHHDPWFSAPFFFAVALKAPHEELTAMGLQPTTWQWIQDYGDEKAKRLAEKQPVPGWKRLVKSAIGR